MQPQLRQRSLSRSFSLEGQGVSLTRLRDGDNWRYHEYFCVYLGVHYRSKANICAMV